MKIIIGSDIHGNIKAFKLFYSYAISHNYDKIILLGDYNKLMFGSSDDNDQLEYMLCLIKSKLVLIKGNSDRNYLYKNKLNLVFEYKESFEKYNVYCAHGDKKIKFDNFENKNLTIVFTGHTHINKISLDNNILFVCPGSIGAPRDCTKGTFATIENDSVSIMDLSFNCLKSQKI